MALTAPPITAVLNSDAEVTGDVPTPNPPTTISFTWSRSIAVVGGMALSLGKTQLAAVVVYIA
jgi:hypothetical protein